MSHRFDSLLAAAGLSVQSYASGTESLHSNGLSSMTRMRASRARREQLALRFAALTAREREALQQVIQGKMNKQIAATSCRAASPGPSLTSSPCPSRSI
jgi:DNA-binding NarL/FixJ family response regulator